MGSGGRVGGIVECIFVVFVVGGGHFGFIVVEIALWREGRMYHGIGHRWIHGGIVRGGIVTGVGEIVEEFVEGIVVHFV